MNKFHTLDDYNVNKKRILLRVDLNVPFSNGVVTNTIRIKRVANTIKELTDKGAIVLLLSHFGRPNGKIIPSMSLKLITPIIKKIINKPIKFIFTDWIDNSAEIAIKNDKINNIFLLENTRFHIGEINNNTKLAKKIANLGDIYINDAFSVTHRTHVSTVGIAKILPSGAGRAMEKELSILTKLFTKPIHPIVAIIGGAKVSSKINVIGNLINKVDTLIIGGGMANTFLAALNKPIGKSIYENNFTNKALEIINTANSIGCKILLPSDAICIKKNKNSTIGRNLKIMNITNNDIILDIGLNTIKTFNIECNNAKTIIWNGPMGMFENKQFSIGTNQIALHIAKLTKEKKIISVAGGGDTIAAIENSNIINNFSYISTGGGAFLEWLEGKKLPGINVLNK